MKDHGELVVSESHSNHRKLLFGVILCRELLFLFDSSASCLFIGPLTCNVSQWNLPLRNIFWVCVFLLGVWISNPWHGRGDLHGWRKKHGRRYVQRRNCSEKTWASWSGIWTWYFGYDHLICCLWYRLPSPLHNTYRIIWIKFRSQILGFLAT